MDPLAEKYYSFSGYNYVMNNPLSLVDPDGRSVEDIIVNDEVWTPGAKPKNDDAFTLEVFNALNSLYDNISEGDVKTPENSGNVIMDFVGKDKPDIIISETSSGSYSEETGKQILWNPNRDLMIGPTQNGKNKPGILSTTTQLAHEFGHAWLAVFSPILNATCERLDAQNKDEVAEHHGFILPKVENRFAKARNEGIRTQYRDVYKNIDEYKKNTGTTGYGDYFINKKP